MESAEGARSLYRGAIPLMEPSLGAIALHVPKNGRAPTPFRLASNGFTAEMAPCFSKLADLPNFAFDRLNRYEAALSRRVGETLLSLDALDRRSHRRVSVHSIVRPRQALTSTRAAHHPALSTPAECAQAKPRFVGRRPRAPRSRSSRPVLVLSGLGDSDSSRARHCFSRLWRCRNIVRVKPQGIVIAKTNGFELGWMIGGNEFR